MGRVFMAGAVARLVLGVVGRRSRVGGVVGVGGVWVSLPPLQGAVAVDSRAGDVEAGDGGIVWCVVSSDGGKAWVEWCVVSSDGGKAWVEW
jgi:hypothetical protein